MKRLIKFTDVYDGEELVRVLALNVPNKLSDEERRDWLWEFTGSGERIDIAKETGYFAESIDGLYPIIAEEWC